MNKTCNRFIATICLLFTPLAFACEYPQRAKVPDGQTASKEEMIEGQKAVKTYMAAMEDYLACIEAEEKARVAKLDEPEPELLAQREEMLNKKYNAAVEEMEIIAAQFNDEVRAYKDRAE